LLHPPLSPTPRQFLIKTDQINPAGWKIKKEKGSTRGKDKWSLFLFFEFLCAPEKAETKQASLTLTVQRSVSMTVYGIAVAVLAYLGAHDHVEYVVTVVLPVSGMNCDTGILVSGTQCHYGRAI
jgi:hypothetical protein